MHRICICFFLFLEQHRRAIECFSTSYRPHRCPHCGNGCLWQWLPVGVTAVTARKADRNTDGALNPVLVPRFRCPSCTRTCSRLPLCICPRRWYGWSLQQNVLQLLIAGTSLRRTANIFALAYHTVRCWWQLTGRFLLSYLWPFCKARPPCRSQPLLACLPSAYAPMQGDGVAGSGRHNCRLMID